MDNVLHEQSVKKWLYSCWGNSNDGLVWKFRINIYTSFINILGWTKPSENEIHAERDALMRSQFFDPIENFPDRIDQLLDVIIRVKNFL